MLSTTRVVLSRGRERSRPLRPARRTGMFPRRMDDRSRDPQRLQQPPIRRRATRPHRMADRKRGRSREISRRVRQPSRRNPVRGRIRRRSRGRSPRSARKHRRDRKRDRSSIRKPKRDRSSIHRPKRDLSLDRRHRSTPKHGLSHDPNRGPRPSESRNRNHNLTRRRSLASLTRRDKAMSQAARSGRTQVRARSSWS
jgi:hypothetical protein